jgi:hypothetical protein
MSDDDEKKSVGSIGDGELTLPSKESVFDDPVLARYVVLLAFLPSFCVSFRSNASNE